MRRVSTIRELVEYAYDRYKTRNAVTIQNENNKSINYFNYKYDIYSLARIIKRNQGKIKNRTIAIMSENRYEVMVTYLANSILNNTTILIEENISKEGLKKIIKKYEINTIFFSNKNKEKIIEIFKPSNKKIINLINFDSDNIYPITQYEKIINIGRFMENYSTEKIEADDGKRKNIIIINSNFTKEYSQEDILESSYIIGKSIRLRRKKKQASQNIINTFYRISIQIILPLIYGICINYGEEKSRYNIIIEEDGKKNAVIYYKGSKYAIENTNINTYVVKTEERLLMRKKKSPNFILIKSNENPKGKNKTTKRVLKLTNVAK